MSRYLTYWTLVCLLTDTVWGTIMRELDGKDCSCVCWKKSTILKKDTCANILPPNNRSNPSSWWKEHPVLIAVENFYPFIEVVEKGKQLSITGPMKDLLDTLSTSVGFQFCLKRSEDKKFGELVDINTWDGMYGMLHRNEVDIVLGPIRKNTSHFAEGSIMKLSEAFHFVYATAVFGEPTNKPNFYYYLTTFEWEVWLTFAVAIFVIGATAVGLYMHHPNESKRMKLNYANASEQFWLFFGVMFSQGMGVPPVRCCVRVLNSFCWIGGIIILGYFSSNLVALMTVTEKTTTIIQLIDSSIVQPIMSQKTLRQFEVKRPELYAKLKLRLREPHHLFETDEEVFSDENMEKVKNGTHAILAMSYDIFHATSKTFDRTGICPYRMGADAMFAAELVMGLRLGMEHTNLTKDINANLQSSLAEGRFKGSMLQYLKTFSGCVNGKMNSVSDPKGLSFSDLQGLFLLYALGVGSGAVALVFEYLVEFSLSLCISDFTRLFLPKKFDKTPRRGNPKTTMFFRPTNKKSKY